MAVHPDITNCNNSPTDDDQAICAALVREIHAALPAAESKIWQPRVVGSKKAQSARSTGQRNIRKGVS